MATARQLLRIARAHVGEQYVFGAKVPKGNPDWQGPWDCAEFTSWCVFQMTGTLFGCRPRAGDPDTADAFTGFWAEDARGVGEEISIGQAAATPGAFLLRVPEAGATGHVVISAGGGKTIEAHSTKRGVIESTADGRRWHTGVLVPGIDVSVPEMPDPPQRPGLVLRVKKPPMRGTIVKDVQRRLEQLGFHPGPRDGTYGAQTAAAVQAFQHAKGLVVDGEVGKRTAAALGVEWFG
jgi:N-acetylmuramoyl-L-alanine amidase